MAPDLQMAPEKSLGFRGRNPYDGLSSCYYRLLEPFLHAHGVDLGEMAQGLFHPLDLRPVNLADELPEADRVRWLIYPRNVYSSHDAFAALDVYWSPIETATFGENFRTALTHGPVLLLPDAFYLPWHPLFQRGHSRMHALMALRFDAGRCVLLDINAPAATGFVRHWACSDAELTEAVVKCGLLSYRPGWRACWEEDFRRNLQATQQYLPQDVEALQLEIDRWGGDFVTDERYSTLQAALLVAIRPPLFLHRHLLMQRTALCHLIPRDRLLALYDTVVDGYRQLKVAERRALQTGTTDHHAVADCVLNSLVSDLQRLADAWMRIRL